MVINDDNNVLSHSDRWWGSSSRKYSDETFAVTYLHLKLLFKTLKHRFNSPIPIQPQQFFF